MLILCASCQFLIICSKPLVWNSKFYTFREKPPCRIATVGRSIPSRKNVRGSWPPGKGGNRLSAGKTPEKFFHHTLFAIRKCNFWTQRLAPYRREFCAYERATMKESSKSCTVHVFFIRKWFIDMIIIGHSSAINVSSGHVPVTELLKNLIGRFWQETCASR